MYSLRQNKVNSLTFISVINCSDILLGEAYFKMFVLPFINPNWLILNTAKVGKVCGQIVSSRHGKDQVSLQFEEN